MSNPATIKRSRRAMVRYCGRELIRDCNQFAAAPRRLRRLQARMLHRSRSYRECTWPEQWAVTQLMWQRIRSGG